MQSPTTISGFHLSRQQRYLRSRQTDRPGINQMLLSMRGMLDRERLRQALETVVARHESLRTKFCQPATLTVPLQVVEPQGSVAWEEVDWSAVSNPGQIDWERAIATVRQQARDRFKSLEHLPTIRAVLGQRSDGQHWLLVSVPALCADVQSLHNLAIELTHAYAGRDRDLIPDEDIVQYPQFAAWQQELEADETDEDAAAGAAFWAQLDNPALNPPLCKYQSSKSGAGHLQTLEIPWQGSVGDFSNLTDPDEAAALLAAWLVVLWRQTERQEFAIGVASQQRSDEELDGGLGAFQYQMPLPGRLDSEMSFTNLVRQVRKDWRQLDSWQDYFQPESCIELPVGFEYLEVPTLTGASSVSLEVDRIWTNSDRSSLRLTCLAQDGRLRAELHYNPETFSAGAVRALAQQWQAAVTHAGKNPEVSLGDISLLGKGEWPTAPIGGTVSTPSSELGQLSLCIHEQFARIAQQLPHRIAVVDEGECLTYRALERRANQLAHALQDLGAGPDIPVALYVNRSVEAIVAILAILKAGSAYLPLDPALPASGVAYRLQDAGVSLILTQQELLSRLPADAPTVFCLETEELDRYPATVPQSSTEPEHLAYLIYTSGSTGKPKAVAVEHRQLMAYTCGAIARMQLPPNANYASVSTLAADLGHTMVFPSLLQGGTLHLLSTERICESQAFATYCQQHEIDCLKIVPSHLQALLQGPNPGDVLPRQRLILGGEASQWSLIDLIFAQLPTCRIFNHYGPTETTVGVLTHEVTAESIATAIAATVPIGAPLPGVRAYLLDPQLRPVAVGVPGELYIGGPTISRGYLNKPQLNTERFITYLCPSDRGNHNSTKIEPIKLYKTGDRARLLPDGALEFLGRVDRQVKLHGFRIELGEIEALLTQHETVKEAVAVVREDRPENPVLVAYITSAVETAVDTSELRQYLQTRLPDYTIPSLFIVLKALPLTPNGKVNLRALPAPEKVQPELSPNFIAPRTELEETIAAVWCEVLQLDVVGVHDNFFDLGGHSLLATQVLSRLQEAFDIDLPLQQLFDARTVAEIAVVIEEVVLAEVTALTEEEAEELLHDAN